MNKTSQVEAHRVACSLTSKLILLEPPVPYFPYSHLMSKAQTLTHTKQDIYHFATSRKKYLRKSMLMTSPS